MPLENKVTRPLIGQAVALPVMDSIFVAVLLYSFQFVLWRAKQQEWTSVVRGSQGKRVAGSPPSEEAKLGWRLLPSPGGWNVDLSTCSQLRSLTQEM